MLQVRFFAVLLMLVCDAQWLITAYHYCLPGSDCWPSLHSWNELNASVGGHLIAPSPPASPCHDGPTRNPRACQLAFSNWRDPFWRADQPGAMQLPNWEADGYCNCVLTSDPATPCHQGAVAVYAVVVMEASDVVEAIQFAMRHRLRLTIKATGHDLLGRSTAHGSLNLWMHHLKNITFHSSFHADGCEGQEPGVPAMTAGAGVQWRELYEAADQQGKVVVGGSAASVSTAGGYTQGGGHGALSPLLGLAADNVLELKVVTADGMLRTVNSCQNKDLFWAMRGGGGGTYGVVVSTTHRAHPALNSAVYVQYIIQAFDAFNLESLVAEMVRLQAWLSDLGAWAGYSYVTMNPMQVSLTYLLPNGDESSAKLAFAPFLSCARMHGGFVQESILAFSTFKQWHDHLLCTANPGVCSDATGANTIVASRLFPKSALQGSRAGYVARAFMQILSTGSLGPIIGHLVAGRAVAARAVNSNGVNPAWRTATWHVVVVTTWADDATAAEKAHKASLLTDMNTVLRELTPDSGAYMNEADPNEPEWQHSFFGSHYPRLLRIKRRRDPYEVFCCRKCVGSEGTC